MIAKVFILFSVCCISWLRFAHSHGMLLEPIGRASRWRLNESAPANYDDNGVSCGSYGEGPPGGKCGLCGDKYTDKQPRAHEIGGLYGEGVIVQRYYQSNFKIGALLTKNHLGYYYVDICNLDKFHIESENCYAQYGPLKVSGESSKLYVGEATGYVNTTATFPSNLICKHCVLRWTYVAGNTWGICDNGEEALGCGPQETFRSCADISLRA